MGDYDESACPIRLKLQTLYRILYDQDNTKTRNLRDPKRSLKTVRTVDGRLLELMSVALTLYPDCRAALRRWQLCSVRRMCQWHAVHGLFNDTASTAGTGVE